MPEPSVRDLTAVICADDTPYKCLPAAMCYGPDSYCSRPSGTPEKCYVLPKDAADTIIHLVNWCTEQAETKYSNIPHPSCKFRCDIISDYQRHYPCVCPSTSSVGLFDNTVVQVLIALLVISCVIHIFVFWQCVLRKKTRKSGYNVVVMNEGDRTELSPALNTRNSQENLTTVVVDNLEADTDVHQPMIESRNLPSAVTAAQHEANNTNNDLALATQHSNSSTSVLSSASSASTENDSGNSSESYGLVGNTPYAQESGGNSRHALQSLVVGTTIPETPGSHPVVPSGRSYE